MYYYCSGYLLTRNEHSEIQSCKNNLFSMLRILSNLQQGQVMFAPRVENQLGWLKCLEITGMAVFNWACVSGASVLAVCWWFLGSSSLWVCWDWNIQNSFSMRTSGAWAGMAGTAGDDWACFSTCIAWASSQHGRLKVVKLLKWWLVFWELAFQEAQLEASRLPMKS